MAYLVFGTAFGILAALLGMAAGLSFPLVILSWMAVGTTATLLSALAFALHEMLACRAIRAKAIPAE